MPRGTARLSAGVPGAGRPQPRLEPPALSFPAARRPLIAEGPLLGLPAQEYCPSGSRCCNQQFTRREYAALEVLPAGAKGYGLFTRDGVRAGQFIVEYVGEVLEEEEYARRKEHYAAVGQRHYYFMNIGNGEVIDACRRVRGERGVVWEAGNEVQGEGAMVAGNGSSLVPARLACLARKVPTRRLRPHPRRAAKCRAGRAGTVHQPLLRPKLRDAKMAGGRGAGHRPLCNQGRGPGRRAHV